ncbi:MAG: LysR family transcriptional regulator [Acidobacteriota bacterium]
MSSSSMEFRELDLRAMDCLRAVVETGGFGPAARALGLTQSAVSHGLARLERQLGETLVVRGAPPEPTEAGRRVLEFASSVTDRLGGLEDELAALRRHRGQVLRLGASPSVTESVLPGLLDAFVRRHPEHRLQVATVASRELVGRVRAGELELGLGPFPGRAEGLRLQRQSEEELTLHVGRPHPLATRLARGDERALRECVLVTSYLDPPEERPSRSRLRHRFAATWQVSDLRLRVDLIAAGHALAFLPRRHVTRQAKGRGLRALGRFPFGRIRRDTGLYWDARRPLSQAAADFAATCQTGPGRRRRTGG